ncbi:MAG: hypothetical protein V4534_00670 [Myxococcota bacterium]
MLKNSFLALTMVVCIGSAPAHAVVDSLRLGFGIATIVPTALHAIAAGFSFESKDQISPIEGEPRRANQEGATASHGVAAVLNLAAMASLPCGGFLSYVGLQGVAGFFAGSALHGNSIAYSKDEARDDHGWVTSSFGVGVAATLSTLTLFVGSIASLGIHHMVLAAPPTMNAPIGDQN